MPEFTFITDLLGEHAYKIVWTALWVLLSGVTIGLLTFLRTTPLSKCVFLSLFAHILLVGHAYMTTLERKFGPENNIVSVTLRDDPFRSHDDAMKDVPRWDNPSNESPLLPDDLALARQVVDAQEAAPERTDNLSPEVHTGVPTETAMAEAVRIHGDQPQPIKSIHNQTTGAASPQIEVPKAERREDTTPSGPRADEAARPNRIVGDDTQVFRPRQSDAPRQPQATTDVQRLIDADTSDPADAIRSREDVTDATINRTLPGVGDVNRPAVAPGQPIPDELAAATDSPGGDGDATNATPSGAAGEGDHASAGTADTHGSDAAGPTRTASPRRLSNGKPLPSIYQLRVAVDRSAAAQRHGGNERTEAAVNAALKWLAANQSADGRWDADKHNAGRETRVFGHDRKGAGANADTGVTALAVLAFMAAGNTHLEGEYRKHVQHGLEFLLRSQARNGNMVGDSKVFAQMYCHGMATLAIAEAYALTGDERLKYWVERAVGYTLATQHSTDGGWRYRPGDEGDMSQFGWQVMALKTADTAGIEIPAKTRAGMLKFMSRCGTGRHGGLASYRPKEETSATMTAESLCCRFFLDLGRDDPAVEEAANYLDLRRPSRGTANLYYWYYGTLALHQLGDARWERWNADLQTQLLPKQRKDGRNLGSWDPADTTWGGYGGRVYSTAMGALCLEAYYRYAVEE